MTPQPLTLTAIPGITLPWRVRDGRPLRRDMDLLRRLLIAIAEGRSDIEYGPSEDDIRFHLGLMIEAGLLRGQAEWDGREIPRTIRIEGITWKGQDFLASVRDESLWQKVRASLSKVGGQAAFEVILSLGIASGKQALGLTQ